MPSILRTMLHSGSAWGRAALIAAACGGPAHAQAFPLPASAGNTTPNEAVAPFLLPLRCTQTKVIDRQTLVAAQAIPGNCGTWDMVSFDPTSRYVFVPCERATANLFRYDTQTGAVALILVSTGGTRAADPATWNPANDRFARLDPAKWTPWNTVLTGEEAIGGRLFEVMNPLSTTGFQVEWRSSIPAVAHEGLGWDAAGNLYFVDENNSGSLYRFVPTTPGDLSVGQTFVLRVDAYAADPNARPAEAYDSASNSLTVRHGAATWVALTDPAGVPLTVTDPFAY
ncbi:MAG TPA: hypothetical protein ENI87_06290, partial [bacterium]|nr:hypothetical protein [bacterium]